MKVNVQKLIERCMEKMEGGTSRCVNSNIKTVFNELDRKTALGIKCKALKNLAKFYEKYMKSTYGVDDIDDFINKLEDE